METRNIDSFEWDVVRTGEKAVHVTSPAPRSIWSELIEQDEEALIPQSPLWTDILCSTGKYQDASRLYDFSGGRKLVLPMVRQAHFPTWLVKQASMPHAWGIGGLVGQGPVQPDEVQAVFADISRQPVLLTSIRPNPICADAWTAAWKGGGVAEKRCAHVLELDCCFDEVWSNKFSHQARGSVRKAEHCGLQVECDTTGKLVPIYYDLMLCSVKRWAEQQHEPYLLSRWRTCRHDPLEKIQRIAAGLGESLHTWVAWLDGKPAAALLVLQGRNVYCFKSAMDKALAGPTHANELLHRLAIEDGCRSGCRRYHLGESGSSKSLAKFKQRFGAIPYDYAEYFFERWPILQTDRKIRRLVKWAIGFKDPC